MKHNAYTLPYETLPIVMEMTSDSDIAYNQTVKTFYHA